MGEEYSGGGVEVETHSSFNSIYGGGYSSSNCKSMGEHIKTLSWRFSATMNHEFWGRFPQNNHSVELQR